MVFIKKKKQKTPEEIEAEQHKSAMAKVGIQDEFQAKGFEIVTWMQDNSKTVLGIIGVVLAGGLVFSGYLVWSRSANEAASVAYEKASRLLGTTETKKLAIAEFEKLARDHSSSSVAKLAELRAAQALLEANDAKGAIKAYRAFLDQGSASGKLKVSALVGLGFAYEANKDAPAALRTFEQVLSEQSGVAEDLIMWEVSRLAKETGAVSKARKVASELVERFSNSTYVTQAQSLLSSLPEDNQASKN